MEVDHGIMMEWKMEWNHQKEIETGKNENEIEQNE
jgi:hypothetical protein